MSSVSSACFTSRKNREYGVLTSNYVPSGFPVVTLTEGKTDGAVLRELLAQLRGSRTHVVLRSCATSPRISDLLLKRLCEHTRHTPWHFFVLVGFDISRNFSEARQRVQQHLTAGTATATATRTATYPDAKDADFQSFCALLKKGPLAEDFNSLCSASGRRTTTLGDWEVQVSEGVRDWAQLCIILVSPPGAGKSEQIRVLRESLGANTVISFDCSSRGLDKASLCWLLEKLVGSRGAGTVLCIDEFHYLTPSQKAEFAAWVRPCLGWLKVVMIANRESDTDRPMLEELRKCAIDPSKAEEQIKVIDGRLSLVKLHRVLQIDKRATAIDDAHPTAANEPFASYLLGFYAAARMLFGEEVNSLRTRRYFDFEIGDTGATLDGLIRELEDNQNLIGPVTMRAFVEHFHARWNAGTAAADAIAAHDRCICRDPLILLCETAMLPALLAQGSTEQLRHADEAMSFPEFNRRLKSGFRAHPCLRLAMWVVYVRDFYGHPLGDADKDAVLLSLRRLTVVQRQGLPRVLQRYPTGELCDLSSCDAECVHGNLADPDWVERRLIEGYSMDWEAFGRALELQPPASGAKLASIAVKSQVPATVLLCPKVEDLMRLALASPDLHELILDSYPPDVARTQGRAPVAPYHYVAWCRLVSQPLGDWGDGPLQLLDELTNKLIAPADAGAAGPAATAQDRDARFHARAELLIWGAEHGFTVMPPVSDAVERSALLRRTIEAIVASHTPAAHDSTVPPPECILRFFRAIFDHPSLSKLAACDRERVSLDVQFTVARTTYPPNPEWPVFMKLLSAAGHSDLRAGNQLTFAQVTALVVDHTVLEEPARVPARLLEALLECGDVGFLDRGTVQAPLLEAVLQSPHALDVAAMHTIACLNLQAALEACDGATLDAHARRDRGLVKSLREAKARMLGQTEPDDNAAAAAAA